MVELVLEDGGRLDHEHLRPGFGFSYSPSLTSADVVAWRSKDRTAAAARDASRTNPYGASAKRATVDSVVGLNFKLQYMPNAELLGVSEEEALEYADMVEN
ncbi:phage portal protein, partial [Klebsiella pneumoniae]|nr:phage portal protein [Klebsiella pneumoniae]